MRRVDLRVFVFTLLAVPVQAGVFHVPGDYERIPDAVTIAGAGDTVLVAPGTYTDTETRRICSPYCFFYHACAFLRDGVTLLSEAGPEATTILLEMWRPDYASPVMALWNESTTVPATVDGFTIRGDDAVNTGMLIWRLGGCGSGGSVIVRNCVFEDFDYAVHNYDYPYLTVENCVFKRCRAQYGGAIRHDGYFYASIHIESCLFEDSIGNAVYLRGHDGVCYDHAIDIQECIFRRNRGGGLYLSGFHWVTIEDCLFVGNTSQTGVGGAYIKGESSPGDEAVVRRNVFRDNHGLGGGRTGGLMWDSLGGVLEDNVFYVCSAGPDLRGSALYIDPDYGEHADMQSNVIYGSKGGPAVYVCGGGAVSGCNLFWGNEGGDVWGFTPGPTDQFIDPQFCDAKAGTLTVALSSPCLPENTSGICDGIEILEAGCGSEGTVVVAIATAPMDIDVVVDAVSWRSPILFNYVPGESHEVTIPGRVEAGEGTRYDFSHWEDGGDTTRTIVVPGVPCLYQAVYDTLHYLDMQAEAGGSVTPKDGYYLRFSWVPICAMPDSGFWFAGWAGQGGGSYTGEDSCAAVQMGCPITQIASFRKNVDVAIASDPPGQTVLVDGIPHTAPALFTWELYSQHLIAADSIQAGDTGTRYRFTEWSDGGQRSHVITVPWDPVTITADFLTEHCFSFETQGRGTVSPDSGWYAAGTEISLEATALPYNVFTHWEGVGSGSYSGPENPVTVVFDGPLHEEAHFFRIAHEVSLSLSDSDPHVVIGDPIGIGQVYLWLVCSTEGGLKGFEGDVTGTIDVLAFAPAAGILNGGDATHLQLVSPSCIEGPAVLGSFFVQDPSGGELCLAAAGGSGILGVYDCTHDTPLLYECPRDVKIHCLRTDGGVPWVEGRGCDEDEDPVGIVLCGFTGEAKDGCVILTWCTSFEYLHAGFHVYRSFDPEVSYRRLTEELVTGESPYSWVDSAVQPGTEYFYRLGAVDYSGWETFHGPISVTTPPWRAWETALELARPNPFSSETELCFTLARSTRVTLSIYDVGGRLVRRLVDEERGAEQYTVTWAGRGTDGRPLPAGVYFSQLVAGDYVQARKVILLRGD
jgi:hypothetical protein